MSSYRPELLTDEEKAALNRAWLEGGRTWKAKLRAAWMSGRYHDFDERDASLLQGLRNASYFGPQGLVECGAGTAQGLIKWARP